MITVRKKLTKKKRYAAFIKLNNMHVAAVKAEGKQVHLHILGLKFRGRFYEGIAQVSPSIARIIAYQLLEASERAMDVI